MTKGLKKPLIMAAAVSLGLSGMFCSQAQAHFPWVNLADYTPVTGKTMKMTIGWGHNYPLGGFLKNEDLEDIFILDPDGGKTDVASASKLEFQTKESLTRPGAYIIAAKRKTGFYTKTTEGGRRQNKKGLKNVIRCSHSQMCAKAVVNVGDGKGRVDARVGHPLEIIPLKNPVELKAGDYLPVQVLLHGKPYNDKIFATYMGFSTDKDVFAYTSKTDRQGRARIRILQPGVWLIKAEHTQPYPDQDVCDVESFIATLTLEVQ